MSLVFQNIDPPPPSPHGECVCIPPHPAFGAGGSGRTHSLGGEGVGGQYFGRRETQLCTLYICKYFVISGIIYP
jgi:hypothetical protein